MARQRWNKEKVIEMIRERDKQGLPLNSDAIVHSDEPLMGAARRYCGSWQDALREAGFDPATHQKVKERTRSWDKATIIAGIKELAVQGVDLNAHAVKKIDTKLVSAGTVHFGSWGEAIEAAGFDYETIRKTSKWSEVDIITTIQTAYKANADLSDNTVSALNPSLYGAAQYHFGSWPNAIAEAGISYYEIRRTTAWSRDKILEALAQGRESKELNHVAVEEFGSLEEARKLIGLIDGTSTATTNRIRERRAELGLSQNELSIRVGCTRAWIGYLERNDLKSFKLSWALKVAKALETTVEEIFEITDDDE